MFHVSLMLIIKAKIYGGYTEDEEEESKAQQ